MEDIYSMIKDALCADMGEDEIYTYQVYKTDGITLDKEKTDEIRAKMRAKRDRGREVLKKYRLRFSVRMITPVCQRDDSILVEAGYIATSPAYREAWLEPR